ncbi:DUF397 domain-containing protein [Streptomyces hydrogenans]|uniref:DUF397 domain-containing protein n=1 Tax=Streptomyces hydrogenans TaxID=1873719 RepID=UPI00382E5F39
MTAARADLHTASLDGASWRKSSYSAGEGECIEITDLPGGLAVRDSKNPAGPALRFTATEWTHFCQYASDREK